jgi:hypothetical protein
MPCPALSLACATGWRGTRRITLHALRILACEIMQRPAQLSRAAVPHGPRLQVALFTAMALLEFANRAHEKCRQRGVAATEANTRHHHIALRAYLAFRLPAAERAANRSVR